MMFVVDHGARNLMLQLRCVEICLEEFVTEPGFGIVVPEHGFEFCDARVLCACRGAGGRVNSLAQWGRGPKGFNCASIRGRICFTASHPASM